MQLSHNHEKNVGHKRRPVTGAGCGRTGHLTMPLPTSARPPDGAGGLLTAPRRGASVYSYLKPHGDTAAVATNARIVHRLLANGGCRNAGDMAAYYP